MRSILATLLLGASLSGAVATAPVAAVRPAPAAAEAAFASIGQRYVASIARFAPSYATTLGDHSADTKLPDVTAAGRAAQAKFEAGLLAELAKLDRKALSRDSQVDAAMLENQLRYDLWDLETLQSWAWNPQGYNDIAAGALYGLAARDFAPWGVRMKAAIARMEGLPALLAETRRQLVPARVPAIFATTVSKQNSGIVEIAEGMLAPHKDALPAADQKRFDAALAALKTAVAEHQKWLDTVLVPAAKGDFRLGAKLYDEKMKFALLSDLSRAELKARAEKAKLDTRAEMYALARQVLGASADRPEAPSAAQQQAAIEAALELSYAKRPARAELMDKARATLAQATDFVRAKGLITLPDAPVKIITMPVFQQGNAVAYCDSPGPLERQLDTFYAISPIPADWSDEQATSFLREYNDYMIHDLGIHEAMPGHYVQIAHSNDNPSTLRALLSSGSFVEGWAVYAEGMMADADYLDGDPLFKLTVLKMRLRSITNTLLDIGIQTEGMTRDQAMALMTQGAFQQEREAAGKWVRASLSSTQLLSYFLGYTEHMAMREEAKARQGAAFDLKKYNDSVLSHGSPPARFVRELMFGLPIE
ncbi:DUF885 domain-containing protein [Sphingomonas sp.]|uniref:DUF885 domain-containing protein n=1 Tax=Sphingomonas sp. TaxID=28214 RepID=UPI001B0CD444|nr:DUF885 domain-containing protein [Sphingomonas sp.]MBO9713590.1 DUF885 domain-containing protein [Sphingomonas sp.]